MLVAFDDTDDAGGGCTTHLLWRALLSVPELALRGLPRLVRLNPNVPHKTRGNGAVCFELCVPEGAQVQVGELMGREVRAFPDGAPVSPEAAAGVADRVWKAMQDECRPGSDPCLVVVPEAPPQGLYWAAVRWRVEVPDAQAALRRLAGVEVRGGGRGLVGALAAAAWPGPPDSFEFIAYRLPGRRGTPRQVAREPLLLLDGTGATFHTLDPSEDRLACVPGTPCPVLVGLRGLDPQRLSEASRRALFAAAGEPVEGWALWATNQASGDHVTAVDRISDAPAWSTVRVRATVEGLPEDKRGGRVEVAMLDPAGEPFLAVAFEPTRDFRRVVRMLRPGDVVEATGALAEGRVRLEKLRVVRLAHPQVKLENPVCPRCGRRMRSKGRFHGYRCREGHGSAPESAAVYEAEARSLREGAYEVPVMARRHLHRPLAFEGVVTRTPENS